MTKIKEIQTHAYKVRSMFLSSMAHELRTPLNSIIPMTNILKSALQNDRNSQRLLEIIFNSSLHLQNIIDDALDLSQIESNRFQLRPEIFDVR